MQQILGIELVIKGKTNTHQTPVVICNHQFWFDIPLVQQVITGNGPIIKFFLNEKSSGYLSLVAYAWYLIFQDCAVTKSIIKSITITKAKVTFQLSKKHQKATVMILVHYSFFQKELVSQRRKKQSRMFPTITF
jgi:hypothetical protein